jgi:hypothetical protein
MSDEDGNQKHLEKFNGTYRDPTQKQIGYPSDSDDDDEEEGGRPQSNHSPVEYLFESKLTLP